MLLKAIVDSLDGIEEHFHSLYTEKNGKFEITGIEGMKTSADVERVQTALNKERTEHKVTKTKLELFGDLKPEDVKATMESLPELQAKAEANGKKFDQAQIDALLALKVAPLEQKLNAANAQVAERDATITQFQNEKKREKIHAAVREAAAESGAHASAYKSDKSGLLLLADQLFDLTEDGAVVVKEGTSLTHGLSIKDVIPQLQKEHSYFWPESVGGGASGGSGGTITDNPFKSNDMTARSAAWQKDPVAAKRLMESAGLSDPGQRYIPKK